MEIIRFAKANYQNLGNIAKYQLLLSPAECEIFLRALKNIEITKLARAMQSVLHLRNDAKNSFKSEGNQNVLECLQQYLRCHRRHFYRRHLRWRQCRPRRQQRRFGRRLSTTLSKEGYTMSHSLKNSFSAAFAAAVSAALFVGASILPALNNASSMVI